MAFRLTSPAFEDGAAIPRRHTCEGEDLSPSLFWEAPPADTRSFAVICTDPDAPRGPFRHWAVFDIPADWRGLPESIEPTPGSDYRVHQAINDFGKVGYGGPCPPRGHGPHHYHFRLLALAVERLGLEGQVRCLDVEKAARQHTIAACEFVGLFQR